MSSVFFLSTFLSSYSCSSSLLFCLFLPPSSLSIPTIIYPSSPLSISRTTNTNTNWVRPSYDKLSFFIGIIIIIISLLFPHLFSLSISFPTLFFFSRSLIAVVSPAQLNHLTTTSLSSFDTHSIVCVCVNKYIYTDRVALFFFSITCTPVGPLQKKKILSLSFSFFLSLSFYVCVCTPFDPVQSPFVVLFPFCPFPLCPFFSISLSLARSTSFLFFLHSSSSQPGQAASQCLVCVAASFSMNLSLFPQPTSQPIELKKKHNRAIRTLFTPPNNRQPADTLIAILFYLCPFYASP